MPSDEEQKTKPAKKGFAGLTSLVSDIGSVKTSTDEANSKTPRSSAGESPTRRDPSLEPTPESQPSNQASSQPSSGGFPTSTVLWVCGGIFFLYVISNSEKNKSLPPSTYLPNNSTTQQSTQAPSLILPPNKSASTLPPSQRLLLPNESAPAQPPAINRLSVEIPPVGDSLTHSPAQLRYCAAERIRIDAAETVINNYSTIDVDKFNDMVNNYNSRCGRFRYRSGTLESAKREVEKYRSELEIEGRIKFTKKSDRSPNSLSTASTTPKPDATILEIQRRLNEFGYSAGVPDGINGPATQAAITSFQRDQGLPITGIGSLDMFRQAQVVEKSTPPSPSRATAPQDNSGTPRTLSDNLPPILGAGFGIMVTDQSGKRAFRSTDAVPLIPGQSYGWYVKLDKSNSTVHWREELTAPYPPRAWDTGGSKASHSISPDGRTLITKKSATPENGLIFNFWSVADGDPTGLHTLKVFIEDQHVRTFVFSVSPK